MKKILLIISVLAVITGCQNSGRVLGNKSRQEKPIIKIGAPMSLTGNGAYYGMQARNGVELALAELNQGDGNFKMEIIYEDTQGDPKQAVNAVSKLINIDGVKILMGPIRSAEASVAAPLAEQAKVVMSLTTPSTEEIITAGDYIFRNRETGKPHGEIAAEFLAKQNKKVAVLVARVGNSFTYRDSFINKFKELGGEVVFNEDYSDKALDFKTLLAKAKRSEAEAFYTAGATYQDAALLVKQIKEMNFSGLIIGSPVMGGENFLQLAGASAEGIMATFPVFDTTDPAIQEYVKSYRLKYGDQVENSFFAANAYDAVKILVLAIEYCSGDGNTDCIRDYLYRVKDYPGIGGLTSFDENGDVIKPIELKIVKDGTFAKYKEPSN